MPRLYEAVQRHYRSRCPCCLRPMVKGKPYGRPHSTTLTQGHVYNARNWELRDVWFRQCRECNSDQDSFELAVWAYMLASRGDPRAKHVVALLAIVYPWLDASGRRPAAGAAAWFPAPRGVV